MDHTKELILLTQKGDRNAKETLVEENAGLIWSVIRRFYGRGLDTDDLFQLGAIGLLKCIDKFDFSFDVKFSTYAVPMIIGEVRRFLRDDGTIKVSRGLKELALKAKITQERMQHEEGREVTLIELATELGVSIEELVVAMETRQEIESLSAPVGEGGDAFSLESKLASKDENEKLMNRLSLSSALEALEERERQIICMRYFLDKTQVDVATTLNLSQVQISRIEKKAILKMRTFLREK